MEALLLYLAYIYWQQYKLAKNTNFLVLSIAFLALLVVDAIDGVNRFTSGQTENVFETHFVIFSGLLIILVYISRHSSWKGRARDVARGAPSRKSKHAA